MDDSLSVKYTKKHWSDSDVTCCEFCSWWTYSLTEDIRLDFGVKIIAASYSLVRKYYRTKMPPWRRAGLTIRGPHTNERRGPFSHTSTPGFSLSGCTFLIPKSWRPFFSRRRTSTQRGKNGSWLGAPWRRGPPPMVQPAQWIIRPCFDDFSG